ncbi:MAG: hypothetical protein GY913_07305 [Proteobacteria bacterium]|nr:hypothetical protein [Pseudomonadota bacterium]MCP4916716.1 hypothetical protein [Pseudomonadota bacterium]
MLLTCIHCADVWEDPAPIGMLCCPTCRHEFPYEPGPVQLLRLYVQKTDGELEGPVDADTIRSRCYVGVYKGREHVRIRDGMWVPIVGWPLFAETFRLVGVDVDGLSKSVETERGWKSRVLLVPGTAEVAAAQKNAVERKSSRRAEHAAVVEKIAAEDQADPGAKVFQWVIAGAVVLAAGAILAMILSL